MWEPLIWHCSKLCCRWYIYSLKIWRCKNSSSLHSWDLAATLCSPKLVAARFLLNQLVAHYISFNQFLCRLTMVIVKSTLAKLALVSIAGASPIAQAVDFGRGATECGLAPEDPKSWGASGADKLLGEWLDKNGPEKWLQGISRASLGSNTFQIDCSSTGSNSCTAPEYQQTCDKYDYLFVRLMSSNINAAFKTLEKKLSDTTISTSLQVEGILQQFDVAKKPEEDDTPAFLKNLALGPTTIGAILSVAPGGAILGGIFATIGSALGAAADNIENNKQEIPFPETNDFIVAMKGRLDGFFTETRIMLTDNLKAMFGGGNKEESDKLVRGMIERMSSMGVQGLNKDAKSPVAELLKSGDFLRAVPDSDLVNAMDAAFARAKQGLIGNLLATMQVYVEQEMPAYNEGEVQPCTALGTFKEGNSCHVIKHIPFGKSSADRVPLESKYLEAMGKHGIDLHTLIRNVRDCNNGEVDNKELKTDGSYPACFFGMNFAQRVHPKDQKFYSDVLARGGISVNACVNYYQNKEKVPEWIKGNCATEIPKWGPCKVTLEETNYWTEAGLDRYQMALIGENVDVAGICGYVQDGRRCIAGSNRACYFKEEMKKWVVEINFAKGGVGHGDYKGCRDDLRDQYAFDNRCAKA
ncbi:hypothetical protein DE146DRAFT_670770 [Phaeosphaeria sp. MPI-PUGE-AT-0046c]|nr:hypothetical protein DE146DRAFT_670770 [Phaeosphaeria sp. MPI-PUGE-AT-0046c]